MDKEEKYVKRLEQRKAQAELDFKEAMNEAGHLILTGKPDTWDGRRLAESIHKMNEASARVRAAIEEIEEFELFIIYGKK